MIAVLLSGGIDSFACLHWAMQKVRHDLIVPIYFDFGQIYAAKEIEAAHILVKFAGLENNLRVIQMPGVLIENPEDGHMPLRNTTMLLFLATLDSINAVVFGMLRGESCEDKNPKYIRIMQKLFDSQFAKSIYRKDARVFKILTPFGKFTKTQVVGWCMENGAHGLLSTVGCFEADDKPCGNCISCFNRWVSLTNNGWIMDEAFSYSCFGYAVRQFKAAKESRKLNPALFAIPQIWRKRYFFLDSFLALRKYADRMYGTTFLEAVHRYYPE